MKSILNSIVHHPLLDCIRLGLRYPVSERLHIVSDSYCLFRKKGITASEYYDFGFEKQDPIFRKTFLGQNEQRVYLDYLNPKKYYILARNKYLSHRALEHAGVRKAQLYCYYDPEGSYPGSDDMAGSLADVIRLLRQKVVQACVIKTTESSHGDNVYVVRKMEYSEFDAMVSLFNGEVKPLSTIVGEDPLIFEELVLQTSQLSDLNPTSVNTVRFMTTLLPGDEARVIACFIKIGRKGKCVDNAGTGGNVDACVDVDTGELKYAIQFDGWRNYRQIEKHPDTGAQLNGMVIENWGTIKSQVLGFQRAFPFIKAAGWDIAITDEGPAVIEVNDFWDRAGQLFIRKGWRDEIRECYFAWKKTGKKYSFGRLSNRIPATCLKEIVKKD